MSDGHHISIGLVLEDAQDFVFLALEPGCIAGIMCIVSRCNDISVFFI